MIAYTRTIDFVAQLFEEMVEVPMEIIDSKTSKYIHHSFTSKEAEAYGLDKTERHQTQRVPGTTKLIVIRSEDLTQVEQAIDGLVEGLQWHELQSMGPLGKQYVYRSRSGDIRFKIGKLRKERTLTISR